MWLSNCYLSHCEWYITPENSPITITIVKPNKGLEMSEHEYEEGDIDYRYSEISSTGYMKLGENDFDSIRDSNFQEGSSTRVSSGGVLYFGNLDTSKASANTLSWTETEHWEFKISPDELEYRDDLRKIIGDSSIPSNCISQNALEEFLDKLKDYEEELKQYHENLEVQLLYLVMKTDYLNRYQRILDLRGKELEQRVRRMRTTEAALDLKTLMVETESSKNLEKIRKGRVLQFITSMEKAIAEYKLYEGPEPIPTETDVRIRLIEKEVKRLLLEIKVGSSLIAPKSELFLKT